MKKGKAHHIYYYTCYKYLFDHPERQIEFLEKILFLIQYDSLMNEKKTVLKYKIYIFDKQIRISYISDLLRVSPVIPLGVDGLYSIRKRKKIQKLMNKFMRLDNEVINQKISTILENDNLDNKYFAFEKYNNKRMRKQARLTVSDFNYSKKFNNGYTGIFSNGSFRRICGFFLIGPWVIGSILFLIGYLLTKDPFYSSNLIYLIIITLLFLIPFMLWTYKWAKPTKYEIENKYLNN